MSDDSKIQIATGAWADNQSGFVYGAATGSGALRVAQTEQEGFELSRAGRRFAIGINATPTGIAPVQAIATTAAQWTLWNTSTTDAYIFDAIGVFLASGTAALTGIVVNACFFTAPAQTGLATGLSPQSMSSSTTTSSMAIKSGVTITAPALPYWFPVAYNVAVQSAVVSALVANMDVRGKIIVPPLTGLGLYVGSATGTTPLFTPFAQWSEVTCTLV